MHSQSRRLQRPVCCASLCEGMATALQRKLPVSIIRMFREQVEAEAEADVDVDMEGGVGDFLSLRSADDTTAAIWILPFPCPSPRAEPFACICCMRRMRTRYKWRCGRGARRIVDIATLVSAAGSV